jgi:hypothetical protein
MFHTEVTKLDRDVCICYNSYTRMLQASLPIVSFVFQAYVISVFDMNKAYISHILQVFYTNLAYV